jgi:hypothetical protein
MTMARTTPRDGEPLHRAAAALALVIGAAAILSPRRLVRAYGVASTEMTAIGTLGWRLFGVRNLLVAGAALLGDRSARKAMLITQIPDQLVFLKAYRSRSLPPIAALSAMLTSAGIVVLGLLARSR